jgi:hypothetical protein
MENPKVGLESTSYHQAPKEAIVMGDLVQKVIDISRGKTPRDKLRARAAEEDDDDNDPLVPDYDVLRIAARRKAAQRTGGRASTLLSRKEPAGAASKSVAAPRNVLGRILTSPTRRPAGGGRRY